MSRSCRFCYACMNFRKWPELPTPPFCLCSESLACLFLYTPFMSPYETIWLAFTLQCSLCTNQQHTESYTEMEMLIFPVMPNWFCEPLKGINALQSCVKGWSWGSVQVMLSSEELIPHAVCLFESSFLLSGRKRDVKSCEPVCTSLPGAIMARYEQDYLSQPEPYHPHAWAFELCHCLSVAFADEWSPLCWLTRASVSAGPSQRG